MQPAQPGDPAGHPAQTVLPPTRTTTLWAAVLCFLAAFGSAVGAGWAVYASAPAWAPPSVPRSAPR